MNQAGNTSSIDIARKHTIQGSAVRLIAIGLQGISSLLIIPISLHFMSSADYAVSVVVRNVGFYLVLAAEIGLGQTIVNLAGVAFARADRREFNAVFTSGLALYVALTGIVLGAVLLAVTTLPVSAILLGDAGRQYPQLPTLIAIYATLVLIAVPFNVFPASLLALREVPVRYALDAAGTVFAFALAALPLVLGFGLAGLVFGSAVGVYATIVGAAWRVRRSHPFVGLDRNGLTTARLRSELTNSAFFLVLGIGLTAQRTAAPLILGQHGLLAEVAVAYGLVLVYRLSSWSLLDLVSRVAQPFVIYFETIGQHGRVVFYASLGTKLTSVLALTIALIFSGVGSRLFRLLGLSAEWPEIALMGTALVIDALFITSLNVLVAINQHRRLAVVYVAYALASFAAGSIALDTLPYRPIVSLAIGLLTASAVSQIGLLPWVVSKALAITLRDYGRTFLLRPTLLAMGAIGAASAIHLVDASLDVLDLPLAVAVVAIAWWFVLNSEDRAACRAFWPFHSGLAH